MPYAADEIADVLRNSVVFVDLNSLSDTTGVPVLLWGYNLCTLPVNDMVWISGMFDDRRFVTFPSAAVGLVLIEPGRKVSTGLADVHFTTCARNSVNPSLTAGIRSVFVGV